ncbi:hypothetical protein H9L39_11430 [Fusarium oxysporum f. sp. albedinis]|nr:hypothetical protein H9L39_11430 [Fusarium oxysporum f. sp. albedinis]
MDPKPSQSSSLSFYPLVPLPPKSASPTLLNSRVSFKNEGLKHVTPRRQHVPKLAQTNQNLRDQLAIACRVATKA